MRPIPWSIRSICAAYTSCDALAMLCPMPRPMVVASCPAPSAATTHRQYPWRASVQGVLRANGPARRESTLVLADIVFVGMQWPVRRAVCGIEEEGNITIGGCVFPYVVGCLVADRIGKKEILGQTCQIYRFVVPG